MQADKNLIKIDSVVLGDWIIKHYGPMSHLKVQKLLFYCDSYHLAYFDEELVSDKFEAWVHGPVSRRVYNSLKNQSVLYAEMSYSQREDGIDVDNEFDKLTSDQKVLITDVLDELSQWTAFELESATHRELPWIEARRGYSPSDYCEVEISKETTRVFYKSQLSES